MLGTFFTITSDDITTSVNYSASLISDFSPLLWLFLGLSVGIGIVYAIIRIFT